MEKTNKKHHVREKDHGEKKNIMMDKRHHGEKETSRRGKKTLRKKLR